LEPSIKRQRIPSTPPYPKQIERPILPKLSAQAAQSDLSLIHDLTGLQTELFPSAFFFDFAYPGAQPQKSTSATPPQIMPQHNHPNPYHSWMQPPNKFPMQSTVDEPGGPLVISSSVLPVPDMAQRKVPTTAGSNQQVKHHQHPAESVSRMFLQILLHHACFTRAPRSKVFEMAQTQIWLSIHIHRSSSSSKHAVAIICTQTKNAYTQHHMC
jgi:hypothetical protein